MKELIEALEITKKSNSMDFDEFADLYEIYYKEAVPEEKREAWRFIGLKNIDFLIMHQKL